MRSLCIFNRVQVCNEHNPLHRYVYGIVLLLLQIVEVDTYTSFLPSSLQFGRIGAMSNYHPLFFLPLSLQ